MKTQSLLVAFVVVVTATAITCQDQGQVYCGRRLAMAVAFFCYEDINKRDEAQLSSGEAEISWPRLAPRRARSAQEGGRMKRQIVQECCEKPCTVDVILTYCDY